MQLQSDITIDVPEIGGSVTLSEDLPRGVQFRYHYLDGEAIVTHARTRPYSEIALYTDCAHYVQTIFSTTSNPRAVQLAVWRAFNYTLDASVHSVGYGTWQACSEIADYEQSRIAALVVDAVSKQQRISSLH